MAIYLKLFENNAQYEEARQNLVLPNVSYCVNENEVHYNPYVPPFFCKLTLNDGSVIKLEGSGGLTSAMTSAYRSTLVGAEIGTQCTSIGDYAFSGCTSLASVTIPDSVTSIDISVFYGCTSLASVTIPDSVATIGSIAFKGCTGLTSVTIGNSVTSIGSSAFQECSSLSSIDIPNSVTTIRDAAFMYCSGLTSVTIGNGITSIGSAAFQGCSGLTSIISHIMTAPSVSSGTFSDVSNGGTLYVPIGSSGYETWMSNMGNLGHYNWTKVEQ